ncbi:MAG TPA: SCP2 sterol-binding domain-containing protein [Ktedonobacterales bacterium]|nr:SCP2 sterol-binding domain-containing protein [Ktedonobacterales bacterium]
MTIDEYMGMLRGSFQQDRARDAHVVIQYEFSGSQEGVCHAVVDAGALQVACGPHPHPTATVRADFDLWLRIVSYQEDGLLLYQNGTYSVEGDVEALMIADSWFKR